MTIDRPPAPPPYRPPVPPAGSGQAYGPADPSHPASPPRGVPDRLAGLAARHPLVIAAVIVSVVVTLATAAATLTAFAASWWWVFDILTSYRPQFALVLMIGVVMLAALRCWRTLVIAVIALALNLVQVAPVFISHQAAALPGSPKFTIAHLNLQSRIGDLQAMHDWLETRPADVVVFLHTAGPTANALRNGVGGYRMIYPQFVGLNGNGRPVYDPASPEVIVVTDRAGVTATTPHFQGLPEAAVAIHAQLGSDRLELLALHTLSPGTSQRHLVRDEELSAVAHWLEATPEPAVAFGDFNTAYYSPYLKKLLHDAHATSSQLGFGIQATWPHQFRPAGIAIDQSIYVGHITAVARYRGPSLGSEHRVLLVTYELAAG